MSIKNTAISKAIVEKIDKAKTILNIIGELKKQGIISSQNRFECDVRISAFFRDEDITNIMKIKRVKSMKLWIKNTYNGTPIDFLRLLDTSFNYMKGILAVLKIDESEINEYLFFLKCLAQ